MPVYRRDILLALTLAAAAAALLLISIPGLNGPLVLDSTKLHALQEIVKKHGDFAVLHTPSFGSAYDRIVSMASFVLNLQIAGELSVFQLKLTNVLIHVMTGVPVFLLTRLIVRTTPYSSHAAALATGTTLLWLLSPTNFNVAMYTIQRMAQLSAFFTLAGLALYTAARLHERAGTRRWYLALCLLVCLPLAVLSKQNGALLIVLAFLVEVYFLHPVRPWLTGRQLTLIAALGVCLAAGLLLYVYPTKLNYEHRDFTLVERLLSQPRALLSYLQHIVFPYGADTGIYVDDFAPSRSLLTPLSTAPSLITGAVIVGFCLLCRSGRLGLTAFGLAFFLAGHLLESTIISLELYFLHRNYLPSYGIYLAVVSVLFIAMPNRKWVTLALSIYAVYFIAIDFARALTWSDRDRIVAAAVQYHPNSPRALSNYAQIAVSRGNFDTALAASDKAIALTGSLSHRVQRLYILCRAGTAIPPDEYTALQDARQFGVSSELSQALDNVLGLYERGGCARLEPKALVESLDRLAARYEGDGGNPWSIAFYADSILYAAGHDAAAHQRLQNRLDTGHLESGLYRVELLIKEGEANQARQVLDQINSQFTDQQLRKLSPLLQEFRRRLSKTD